MKLHRAKASYSLQELQSINVLNENGIEENQRILEDANQFLNVATNISALKKNNKEDIKNREMFGEFIEEKDIDEEIQINLTDLENKIYTIADLAFKSNKYTKWLCEEAIFLLTDNNYAFGKILRQMKTIYNKVNTQTRVKSDLKEELNILAKDIRNGQYEGWEENVQTNLPKEELEDYITNLYADISQIWDVENVLYEMKTSLSKQLVTCLIKDEKNLNNQKFAEWGFELDESIGKEGMWVLNFSPNSSIDRYAFHIPNLAKILSQNLKRNVKGFKIYNYQLHFTSTVRKNNLDKIKNKFDNKELIEKNKKDIIEMFSRQNVDTEQYTIAKFMEKEDFENLTKEYPHLKQRCDELKGLTTTKRESNNIEDDNRYTEYEEDARKQIEENIKRYKRIYIQYGENLDKYAAIYALRKHMKSKGIDDIEVIQINAGEDRKNIKQKGLFIDAGFLRGCSSLATNFKGSKEINANEARAERSASGVLSQFGIYVPKKIVQHADEVIDDERTIDARYGLHLCRKLRGEKLFDFAKERREDGTYLIESTLTDEELNKWGLYNEYQKREEELQRDTRIIADNIYTINESNKHICIVDKYVNCGSWIAYSLGCDYYLSISDTKADFVKKSESFFDNEKLISKATFCMLANPKKGDGKLPNNIIKWCEQLRDDGENNKFKMITINRKGQSINSQKPFISPKQDKAIFGGLKTPNLFVTSKNKEKDVAQALFEELKSAIGFEKTTIEEKEEVIDESTKNWKHVHSRQIIDKLLQEIKDLELTRTQIYTAGQELLDLTNERGEKIVEG